jgi:membrane-associated phospholipid phosphatase
MFEIEKIIHYIGWAGPNILIILTIFILLNKKYLLMSFIVGYGFNLILNLLLKGIVKQPRPKEDIKLVNLAINSGRRMGFDIYGMPSGHAQLVFYCTIFIYLVTKKNNITLFYLFISFITLYQRVLYKNHTISQVVVGSFVGSLMGYVVYHYAEHLIKGYLKPKKEDYAI